MTPLYRILYVDDAEDLLEIGKFFLEEGGLFSVDIINSAPASLTLLNSKNYDAIISDYQMPGMDGIELLKKVRTSGSTIPFILFTGRGREEVVIQALNEGADYYLQKGGEPVAQFTELAHKIRQAILQRRAETSIRDHERREADIINFLPDATFAIDTNGIVIAWNHAMEKMTGVTAAEMLGKGNYEYSITTYHERRPILIDLVLHDNPSIAAKYPSLQKVGRNLVAEVTSPHLYKGKGASIWFTAAPLYNNKGEVEGAIESIRDISDRKQAEDAQKINNEHLQMAQEIGQTGSWELDLITGKIWGSEEAFRIFEILRPADGILSLEDVEARIPDRVRVHRALTDLIENGVEYNIEYAIETADNPGGKFVHSVAKILYDAEKKPVRIIGVTQDITERKLAEELVHESENKFSTVFFGSPVALTLVSAIDGTFVNVNDSFVRETGYTRDEVIGVTSDALGIFADRNEGERLASSLRDTQTAHDIEIRCRMKNGEIRPCLFSSGLIQIGGKPHVLSTVRDITKRKRAESALEHQTAMLAFLNNIITTANKADNLAQLLDSILTESLRMLDFDAGGIYLVDRSTRMANIVHSKNLPKDFLAEIQTAPIDKKPYDTLFIKNKPIITENYAKISPDLSKKFGFQSIASIPLLSKGVAIGALNLTSTRRQVISEEEKQMLISISSELGSTIERMVAEEKAKNASKDLETLFNSIDEMVFVLDMQGRIIVVNTTVLKRLSYTSEELTGTDVLRLHVPERRDEALRIIQGMIAGTIASCPVPLLAKDGTRIEVETRVTRGWWNGKEVLIGVTRDITERKRAEEMLAESIEHFRTVIHSMQFGIVIIDAKTHTILDTNDKALEMIGCNYESVLGSVCHRFICPAECGKCPVTDMGQTIDSSERVLLTIQGREKPILKSVIKTTLGKKEVLIESFIDITVRKRMEEALKQSEERHRTILQTTNDGFWIIDLPEGNITDVNETYCRMSGYTRAELLKMHIRDLDAIKNPDEQAATLRKIIKNGSGILETRHHRKDGSVFDVELSVTYQNTNGARLICFCRDITERKKLEKRMESHEMELREFSSSLATANKKLTLLSSITRHDINNQLTLLMGFLTIIKKKQTDPALDEYFGKVSTTAQCISSIIQFTREYEEIGVSIPVWQDVRTVLDTAAQQVPLGKIVLKNDIAAGTEMFADPLIVKVFYNLMDNAVRYGGKITTIRFSCEGHGGDQIIVCEDDGDGIVTGEKDKIFDKGFGKNTGLGLALSREILDISGITIKETGESGKGARFEIIVPKGGYRFSDIQ